MSTNVCFKAYVNEIDTIVIEDSNESNVFFINDKEIAFSFVSFFNGIYTFEAKYPVECNQNYTIRNTKGLETNLAMKLVARTNEFDDLYFYEKDDLGPTYSKEATTFRVWAPTSFKCELKYIIDGQTFIEEMNKGEKGTYYITIHKDLANALYCYILYRNNKVIEANDLYCFSFNSNSKMSAVIDLSRIEDNDHYKLPDLKSINEAIIYEVNVRDFSSDNSLGEEVNNTFNAFLKEGLRSKEGHKIGFDYIKDLGVTHIQFQPLTDFATVNEDDIKKNYNWGYDPVCFNVLEGSYSSKPNDPYNRIIECKKMIEHFHKNNLRVCIDMVFNHTYHFKHSIFNNLIQDYYYLMDRFGNLSNGSFCGNDLDTTRKMYKKYVLDMCKRLVTFYKFDGIRFDLMGILTVDMMQEIEKELKKINPNIILYGEGWNMPSMLNEWDRASLNNQYKLNNISYFNDYFRDTMRGKGYSKTSSSDKGYLSGDVSKATDAIKAIRGSIDYGCYFEETYKSINYVECHDNSTLYDKLLSSNKENSEEERNRMQLCMIAASIFSLGVPFIHMGVEFNRTKQGIENSYNSPDSINQIDWSLVDKNYRNVKAVKDFIRLRKEYPYFHLNFFQEIMHSVDSTIINNKQIRITIAGRGSVGVLVFNPTKEYAVIPLNGLYKRICNTYGIVGDMDEISSECHISPYSFEFFSK